VKLSKKPDAILSISYVDTGLDDAEVTILAFGGAQIDDPAAK
jgi:hypothetical protein